MFGVKEYFNENEAINTYGVWLASLFFISLAFGCLLVRKKIPGGMEPGFHSIDEGTIGA